MFGCDSPPGVVGPLGDQPHHPRMEPGAPVGPAFAAVLPAAIRRVDRQEVGVAFDGGRELVGGGELKRALEPRLEVTRDRCHVVRPWKTVPCVRLREYHAPRISSSWSMVKAPVRVSPSGTRGQRAPLPCDRASKSLPRVDKWSPSAKGRAYDLPRSPIGPSRAREARIASTCVSA